VVKLFFFAKPAGVAINCRVVVWCIPIFVCTAMAEGHQEDACPGEARADEHGIPTA
jgi:hypothetical protein